MLSWPHEFNSHMRVSDGSMKRDAFTSQWTSESINIRHRSERVSAQTAENFISSKSGCNRPTRRGSSTQAVR